MAERQSAVRPPAPLKSIHENSFVEELAAVAFPLIQRVNVAVGAANIDGAINDDR